MDAFELGSVHPTALVDSAATIGDDVTIGPYTVVEGDVVIGEGTVVGSHCTLGEPTAEFYSGQAPAARGCVIGEHSIIRSHTVIYRGVRIGAGFETGHRVTIREGSDIGVGVRVGTLSDLQGDLRIGDYARLHSGVFVPARSVIGEFAWLFPHVTLLNDPHPPSDTCTAGPRVGPYAVIAARSVLMPAVEVGGGALVGAASLVVRDVPADTVVIGSPAREVGPVADVVCKHGELDHVYPWPDQFRRGYPSDVLPPPNAPG